MNKKAKITILCVNTALCLLVIVGMAVFMRSWGWLMQTLFYALAAGGLLAGFGFYFFKLEALLKTVFVLEICVLAVLISFIAVSSAGGLNGIDSDAAKMEKIVDMIRASGHLGMLVYILIQILQVVVLPLPAVVCYVSGVQIWSPMLTTLLASIGVIAGSVIAYYLGRIFGRRVVEWIAGKETTEKYGSLLAKRGKVLFIIMQILPFFPDDILCMVAGLTSMSFPFFMAVMVLVRPAIIALYCFLGSGTIIPFHGWGIAVWIAIFAVCVTLAVLSFFFQDRIENFFRRKFSKDGLPEESAPNAAKQESADAQIKTADCSETEKTELNGKEQPLNRRDDREK